jgi:hypothetical protein
MERSTFTPAAAVLGGARPTPGKTDVVDPNVRPIVGRSGDVPPTPPPAMPQATPTPALKPVPPSTPSANPGSVSAKPAVTPPVSAATPARNTGVERYRVQAVLAVDGDTWESFSVRFLGDARYADALREFNRNYDFSPDLLRKTGKMLPGTTIHVPPAKVLIDRHGTLIREPAGGATASPAPTARPF